MFVVDISRKSRDLGAVPVAVRIKEAFNEATWPN